MRWEDGEQKGNVEDRRGKAMPLAAGGGLMGLIIMGILFYLTGDLGKAKRLADGIAPMVLPKAAPAGGAGAPANPNDANLKFAEAVMGLTDEAWETVFSRLGKRWEKPTLVLFSDRVDSEGCGMAPSAVGPFYCPASKKVFLDPTFFDELRDKLKGSSADFSKAYVIAHEVGHHAQNILGYNTLLEQYRKKEGENAGIRLELQADYLAGACWHHVEKKRGILEKGDVEEAIRTAQAIGDDRLQKNAGRWVNPESFNHGTASQRLKFFMEGFQSGDASKRALDQFFDPSIKPLDL
jgi:predicted metalloprotease